MIDGDFPFGLPGRGDDRDEKVTSGANEGGVSEAWGVMHLACPEEYLPLRRWLLLQDEQYSEHGSAFQHNGWTFELGLQFVADFRVGALGSEACRAEICSVGERQRM